MMGYVMGLFIKIFDRARKEGVSIYSIWVRSLRDLEAMRHRTPARAKDKIASQIFRLFEECDMSSSKYPPEKIWAQPIRSTPSLLKGRMSSRAARKGGIRLGRRTVMSSSNAVNVILGY
jgi:hypothetical protein